MQIILIYLIVAFVSYTKTESRATTTTSFVGRVNHLTIYIVKSREHEGTERDTEGVGCDVIVTKVIFRFPRRPHGIQPRSEVFSEIIKANFNDNGDLS